jgi:hypothetical protein
MVKADLVNLNVIQAQLDLKDPLAVMVDKK